MADIMRLEPAPDLVDNFVSISQTIDRDLAVRYLVNAKLDLGTALDNFFATDGYLEDDSANLAPNPAPTPSFSSYDYYAEGKAVGFPQSPPSTLHASTYEDEMAHYRFDAPTRPPSRHSSVGHMSPELTGNLEDYEMQWALTVPEDTYQSAHIFPDLEPLERYRLDEEPGYLKPCINGDPIAAVLVVLAQIPWAQKLFLELAGITTDYGEHTQWWTGASISTPDDPFPPVNQPPRYQENRQLLIESQRVFASLVYSDRLYTSVEPLLKLPILHDTAYLNGLFPLGTQLPTFVDRFIIAWSNAVAFYAGFNSSPTNFFRTLAIDAGVALPLYVLQIDIERIGGRDPLTLYDTVDNLIWKDKTFLESTDIAHLDKLPQVLVLRVVRNDREGRCIDLDIPAQLYLDRWLGVNQDKAMQMRRDIAHVQNEMNEIDRRKRELGNFQYSPAGGQASRNIRILEEAIAVLRTEVTVDDDEEFDLEEDLRLAHKDDQQAEQEPAKPEEQPEGQQPEGQASQQQPEGQLPETSQLLESKHSDNDVDMNAPEQATDEQPTADIFQVPPPTVLSTDQNKARELADKLDAALHRLKSRLHELDVARYALEQKADSINRLFKQFDPALPSDHELQPKNLYNLRGVCSDHRRVYLQRYSNTPDEEQDWWCYEYTSQPSVERATVSRGHALQAARAESAHVLLIYAANAACAPHSSALTMPAALRDFVDKDNDQFAKERDEVSQMYRNNWANSTAAESSVVLQMPPPLPPRFSEDGHPMLHVVNEPPPYEDVELNPPPYESFNTVVTGGEPMKACPVDIQQVDAPDTDFEVPETVAPASLLVGDVALFPPPPTGVPQKPLEESESNAIDDSSIVEAAPKLGPSEPPARSGPSG